MQVGCLLLREVRMLVPPWATLVAISLGGLLLPPRGAKLLGENKAVLLDEVFELLVDFRALADGAVG